MDLNTQLPGPPGPADRASGSRACNPALDFSRQSGTEPALAQAAETNGLSNQGGLYEKAAHTAVLAASERDKFLEGWLKIQEDERLRLGRELHDSTGQLLLALRLNVAQLKRSHGTAGEDDLLSEIEDTASQIDREIRSFAFLHYPAEIERDGLAGTLCSLSRGFAARTGLKVSFVDLSDRIVGSSLTAIALLRVAQEALMNVHRHARAMHVRVSLAWRRGLLELVIRDDGIGIPDAGDIGSSHGVGMVGMRHRVERIGGNFAVKRMKHGTKLVASVPLG
jgi:two-component system NarL family sensor kinase